MESNLKAGVGKENKNTQLKPCSCHGLQANKIFDFKCDR